MEEICDWRKKENELVNSLLVNVELGTGITGAGCTIPGPIGLIETLFRDYCN